MSYLSVFRNVHVWECFAVAAVVFLIEMQNLISKKMSQFLCEDVMEKSVPLDLCL